MLNLWTYPSWRMPELPPVEPWKRHEERTLRDFWVGKMRVREDEKVRRRGEPEEECDRITSSVLCVGRVCVCEMRHEVVGEGSGPRQRRSRASEGELTIRGSTNQLITE
jgi:hypothetical protein